MAYLVVETSLAVIICIIAYYVFFKSKQINSTKPSVPEEPQEERYVMIINSKYNTIIVIITII